MSKQRSTALATVGTEVTVPTTKYRNGERVTVRRRAIITRVNASGTLVQVRFTVGNRKGLFGYASPAQLKKARKSRNNEYAFGRIVDWNDSEVAS